nr:hypothetical protein [uncultured Pedobacter sp.]
MEIIGEASTKIDDEFKSIYPNIEWRKMSNYLILKRRFRQSSQRIRKIICKV